MALLKNIKTGEVMNLYDWCRLQIQERKGTNNPCNLIFCDMDGVYRCVDTDALIVVDDCGNSEFLDQKRWEVIPERIEPNDK